ncbi:MAG: thioredoxin family protein [Nannocystaceae bacterium]
MPARPPRPALSPVVAVALAAGLACGGAESPVPKDSKAESAARADPAPTPAREAAGVRDDGSVVMAVDFFDGTLEQALAKAKAEGKHVLVDVGAYWCHSCHDLDEQVFTVAAIGDFLRERVVAVKIDAEKDEGPDVVARYKVQAYPTVLILEATGVERGRMVEVADADALKSGLERILGGGDPLAALVAEVEAKPDDLEARYRLASSYALAARRAEAEPLYDAVLAGDPDNAKGLAAKVLYDRAAFFVAKMDGDSRAAVARYRELQGRYPGAKESIRAYRAIGRELHRLGDDAAAIQSLEAMIAAKPEDVALKASYGWFSFRERCDPAAGLRAVEAGLAQAPKDAELHYLRAELRHLTGDPQGALASIREAAALEPKTAYYQRQVRRFEGLAGGGA